MVDSPLCIVLKILNTKTLKGASNVYSGPERSHPSPFDTLVLVEAKAATAAAMTDMQCFPQICLAIGDFDSTLIC